MRIFIQLVGHVFHAAKAMVLSYGPTLVWGLFPLLVLWATDPELINPYLHARALFLGGSVIVGLSCVFLVLLLFYYLRFTKKMPLQEYLDLSGDDRDSFHAEMLGIKRSAD